MKQQRVLRIGVLGSGSGSNCQAIFDAIDAGQLHAQVVCVISDVADARILDRARGRGVPAYFIDAAPFRTKLEGTAEAAYIAKLQAHGAEVIALAGFMRIVKGGLLAAFPNRILNIHPALLPAFPGVASWAQALAYGVKLAGCTVHLVDAGTDSGPILVQRAVPVLDDDTPESLHARIQEQEHQAYPEALRWIAEDRLVLTGRRVTLRPPQAPAPPPTR